MISSLYQTPEPTPHYTESIRTSHAPIFLLRQINIDLETFFQNVTSTIPSFTTRPSTSRIYINPSKTINTSRAASWQHNARLSLSLSKHFKRRRAQLERVSLARMHYFYFYTHTRVRAALVLPTPAYISLAHARGWCEINNGSLFRRWQFEFSEKCASIQLLLLRLIFTLSFSPRVCASATCVKKRD